MSEQRQKEILEASTDLDVLIDKATSGEIPWRELANMFACDLGRINEIASGQPYYDYTRQDWIVG